MEYFLIFLKYLNISNDNNIGMHGYKISTSLSMPTIGDISEIEKTIYIDKRMPKKFKEGIAVHEVEEREWLKKGNTYKFSHNKAQQKELQFYRKKFGSLPRARGFLKEEEKYVTKVFIKQLRRDLKKLK